MEAVLGKVAKFITAITLTIRAVTAKHDLSIHRKKHLSSPEIILIVEGATVAVSWCAAWCFSTSLIISARVWGPSYIFWKL